MAVRVCCCCLRPVAIHRTLRLTLCARELRLLLQRGHLVGLVPHQERRASREGELLRTRCTQCLSGLTHARPTFLPWPRHDKAVGSWSRLLTAAICQAGTDMMIYVWAVGRDEPMGLLLHRRTSRASSMRVRRSACLLGAAPALVLYLYKYNCCTSLLKATPYYSLQIKFGGGFGSSR